MNIKNKIKIAGMTQEGWGTLLDGSEVSKFTLTNINGIAIGIITYGGIIQSINVPDEQGNLVDIVLGFESIKGYEAEHPYFGAIIGRYGNRIANAKFTIDNISYELASNNEKNHLHGGIRGFDKVLWQADSIGHNELLLTYRSAEMEEGYPGILDVFVTYKLTDSDELLITYEAKTDKKTHVNLTNHSYFNLNGSGDILDHVLELHAERYTPVNKDLIPTGEEAPVKGSPFDFTKSKKVGLHIDQCHQQITYGGGYDHNWILNNPSIDNPFAQLYSEKTGITMTAYTTEPGVQFYTANFLDGSLIGKNDITYNRRGALCLETQHYPDSPNQPSFPSTLLTPDAKYFSQTKYRFERSSLK